jgi:hypothetical protein
MAEIPERVRKIERILYGDLECGETGLVAEAKELRDQIIKMQFKVVAIGAGVSILTTIVVLLLTHHLSK